MRLLVVGEARNLNECRQKFGDEYNYFDARSPEEAQKYFDHCDLIFDFVIDHFRDQVKIYESASIPVFLNTTKISLSDLVQTVRSDRFLFGFAGLNTFFDREVLEVCLSHPSHHEKLKAVCVQLKTAFEVVRDCAGLVTPRVICMIINEAYYTAAEGTATREDIDLAMKLGTNYPLGPFEWCQKIGVADVYRVLSRVYEDSGNERYRICPLLEKEYLEAVS